MVSNRTCSTCLEDFQPSSRHRTCPRCRSKERRDKCPVCQELKQRDSRVCSNCVDYSGEFNSAWRGGRTRHTSGYVMVSVPGHPRVEGRTSPYVMEHILVMEEQLGRYLYEGENVHHLNGVKHDNRPENLELWTRPQPAGARVTDLVKWAREVIETYSDF